MNTREQLACEAIRAWRAEHSVDPSVLTVDDLPGVMVTPEIRERLDAMPAEDRALVLWIGLAAATMTPEQRAAVGFKVATEAERGASRSTSTGGGSVAGDAR